MEHEVTGEKGRGSPTFWLPLAALLAGLMVAGCGGSSSGSSGDTDDDPTDIVDDDNGDDDNGDDDNGDSGDGTAEVLRYAYVLNENDPSVSWYQMNPDNGDPRHLGYLYLGEQAESVHDMVLHPGGEFLYVSDPDGGQIHRLEVATDEGTVEYAESIDVQSAPRGLAVGPNGDALFYASPESSTPAHVRAYELDGDGSLNFTVSAQLPEDPEGVALDPAGEYLYVALGAAEQIAVVDVAGGEGDVELVDTDNFAAEDVKVDPNGEFLYAAGSGSHSNLVLAVGAGGELTETDRLGAGSHHQLSVAPSGLEFYSTNVNGFAFVRTVDAATGSLSDEGQLAPAVAGVDAPYNDVVFVAADPTGQFVYTGASGSVDGQALGVAPAGAAEDAHELRFASVSRPGPLRMVFATGADPVRVTAERLYVANSGGDEIDHFAIAGPGELDDRRTYASGTDGVQHLAMIPNHDALLSTHYSQDEEGETRVVRLDDEWGYPLDGEANAISGTTEIQTDLVAEASGRFTYASNQVDYGELTTVITRYVYDPEAHELSEPAPGIGGLAMAGRYEGVDGVTTGPAGRFLFSAWDGDSSFIRTLRLDPETGNVSNPLNLDDVTANAMVVTPDGRTLVTVTDSELVTYRISAADGALEQIGSYPLEHPGQDVAVHPSGQWAYVAGLGTTSGGDLGLTTYVGVLEAISLDEDGVPGSRVHVDSSSSSFPMNYRSVFVSPDGTAVYLARSSSVLGDTNGSIRVFAIDPETSDHLEAPAVVSTVSQPNSLAIRATRQ